MTWEGLTPPYSTIVADPPWHYDRTAPSSSGSYVPSKLRTVGFTPKPMPYLMMSVDEIAALPVAGLAAADARLFLWTTNRYLPQSFRVMVAWGFTYRQLLVWRKTGNPSPMPGSVAPNHAEYLLVGSKGNPGRSDLWPTSVVDAPKLAHSQKPAVFLDLVERVSPGPYVELFARAPRFGWDSWGYGYEVASC